MTGIPTVKLSNGQAAPFIGFGTYKCFNDDELVGAIKEAIKLGYRHFDCAFLIYENEKIVGRGLREAIEESNGALKREDLFIVSKVWNTRHSKAKVREATDQMLSSLGVGYLDVLLVHWPMAYAENQGLVPKDENGKIIFHDVHYLETYHALEDMCREGKTKSIGLSNFNIEQTQDILNNSTIKPVMMQVEINPHNQNIELIEFCHKNGIQGEAYTPLGANDRGWLKPEDPVVLENPTILKLAEKHKRSPAQICIKWLLQRNIVVVVKSVNPSRLKQNMSVQDFELSAEDMQAIKDIRVKFRYYAELGAIDHPFYPFEKP